MRPLLASLLLVAACKTDKAAPADTAPGEDVGPAPEVPCDSQDPLRQLYWGDLHVHTALSFDAWTYDVRLTPDDAYAFARGEPVALPPLDASGAGTRTVQLSRPLDFAAVTDHAEYYAEIAGCTTPGSPIYDDPTCASYREADVAAIQAFGTRLANPAPYRFESLCADGALDCAGSAGDVWADVQRAANDADDDSAQCRFTAFVGYEWSGATGVSNFHRNVVFANEVVPDAPTSYFEAAEPWGLWDALQRDCLDAGTGCDVLAIPHNANLSNGRQFALAYPADRTEAEAAAFRARVEPLLEVYQHKGDSECVNGLSGLIGGEDEWCRFEDYTRDDATDCMGEPGALGMTGNGCVDRLDTLRGILAAGLEEEARIGVNPYRLGVIASTDTHSGTPGRVDEADYTGHLGDVEDDVDDRLREPGLVPGGFLDSPGGLVAVWAEENSRGALFDALRRRETYGTSGPRMAVRFFGGWELPTDLCDDAELVARADDAGVPMGGLLDPADSAGPPRFVVSASADPDGVPLQRVQIIKGWTDASGASHVAVFEVAGGDDGASVDLDTCAPEPAGSETLCGAWTDPDFDPAVPAFYYARVLEDPTCRWSWRDCLTLAPDDRPALCEDPSMPKTLQERAWTSPIWVTSAP
jgi:hypothetical protein